LVPLVGVNTLAPGGVVAGTVAFGAGIDVGTETFTKLVVGGFDNGELEGVEGI